ncbi:related to Mig1 protein, induced during biotrophic phase [Ustilago bromivora]|uniref:Related to Mig1 protein, induced during biotrophic phase n=1 Tax=Ustilago bromivora TaxID=307758 RepID=A0A8H8QR96_9BASI|nr:related to Mig1 protein, induced during biotrophic phase [Ustilago bromivora]
MTPRKVCIKCMGSHQNLTPGTNFQSDFLSVIDFTTVDPTKDFGLEWYEGTLQMSYSDFDKEKGCFKITLEHFRINNSRIWVSAENSKEPDIDTLNHVMRSKILCTKWVHIHVKQDG